MYGAYGDGEAYNSFRRIKALIQVSSELLCAELVSKATPFELIIKRHGGEISKLPHHDSNQFIIIPSPMGDTASFLRQCAPEVISPARLDWLNYVPRQECAKWPIWKLIEVLAWYKGASKRYIPWRNRKTFLLSEAIHDAIKHGSFEHRVPQDKYEIRCVDTDHPCY